MTDSKLKQVAQILLILALAGSLRAISLGSPPIGRHAWRQADTAAVARNFHEVDPRILYPQVDWMTPGYAEMEFPLYSWTVAAAYGLFGEAEALARLLSVAGSLVAILFVYLVVTQILGRSAGLWSAFLCAVLPMSLFYGRAIMPEAWMLAFLAAGVYGFLRWSESGSWTWYFFAALTIGLASLLKLTSLHVGLPLLWLAYRRYGRRTLVEWRVWLFGLLVLVPQVLWYRHAYILGKAHGASFQVITAAGADKWGDWSLLLDSDFYSHVFLGTVGGRLLTWAGLAALVAGLLLPRTTARERLLDVWLMAGVILILLVNRGSFIHEYYSLPLLLPAVGIMAKAIDHNWKKRRLIVLGVVALIVASSGYDYAGYLDSERVLGADGKPQHPKISVVADQLSAHTESSELVLSCDGPRPMWFYFSRRRGWGEDCKAMSKLRLSRFTARDAKHLVAWRPDFADDPETGFMDYVETFFEDRSTDERVLLAALADPLSYEAIRWRQVFGAGPRQRPESDWRVETGDWTVEDGALVGGGRRASAIAPESFAGCSLCRVRATVEILSQLKDGGPRRAVLLAWREDTDTHVSVTFDLARQEVRFQQREKGNLLRSLSVPAKLQVAQPTEVELRFDLFDFEVLVAGERILSTASYFSSPPRGGLSVEAHNTEVRVEALEAWVPARSRAGA